MIGILVIGILVISDWCTGHRFPIHQSPEKKEFDGDKGVEHFDSE